MPTTRPTRDPAKPGRPFHPGLEGLRGLAVAVVLLFHDGIPWMQGGFLGVSTFFTLSGFLITGLLLTEYDRTERIDLPAFWGRRFRRLMPAALLTLFGIALFGHFVADVTQRERLLGDGLAALFYVANWWLIATDVGYVDLMGSPSPVQHFWSLAIEEQYYAVYPLMAVGGLVLARLRRRSLGVILALLMGASWIWMAWLSTGHVSNARIYYGTDTRAGELLAGGILAIALGERGVPERLQRSVAWLGVAALAVCGWLWATSSTESDLLYSGVLAIHTLASTAIIAAAILPGGPIRQLLSGSVIRWVGRVSYGIYLIHWPVYLWLDSDRSGLDGFPLTLLRLLVTFTLAAASWVLLEEPVRRGRFIVGWRRRVVPPVAILLVAGAFILSADWPSSGSNALFPFGIDPIGIRPNRKEGANETPIRVLVVGDSVAHNIGNGLIDWADRTGLAVVKNAARKGCGIARGGRIGGPTRAHRICEDWDHGFARPIRQTDPDIVVVYSAGFDLVNRRLGSWPEPKAIGDPDFDRWLRSEYDSALALFTSRGARVVWLSPLCLGRPPAPGGNSPLDPERTRLLTENIIKPLARESDRVAYVDLFSEVCPGGRFTNDFAGISDFRPDGIHFSEAGARWVGRWLGRQILETDRHDGGDPPGAEGTSDTASWSIIE